MIQYKYRKSKGEQNMNRVQTTKKDFTVNYNQLFTDILEKEGTISDCFRVFHNYSINNQFLAYWQLKQKGYSISPLNTFNGWKKLNRSIKAGEKALYLWMPMGYSKTVIDEETGLEKQVSYIKGFKFLNRWFSMEQTKGDIDNKDVMPVNDNFDFNKVLKEFKIKLIPFEKFNGNVQGYARLQTNELAINPLAEDKDMTVLHEIAHLACNHLERKISDDLKELEAETVAYIVGSVIGADETQLSHSRGYIQGWFKGNEIPEDNAKHIMSVANKILKVGYKK